MNRIFAFKLPMGTRYIALDYLLQLSDVHGTATQAGEVPDKDGILTRHRSSGSFNFQYQMAFQEKWESLSLSYDATCWHPPGRVDDGYEQLLSFQAEFERLKMEWTALRNSELVEPK